MSKPSARIAAVDYGFEATGLKAGKAKVAFDNTGKEPHFAAGLPIKPGKTIRDVWTFFRTQKDSAQNLHRPASGETASDHGKRVRQVLPGAGGANLRRFG